MKARILLVEDDREIVHSLSELLTSEGATVICCDTQDAAIAYATGTTKKLGEATPFDIVLMDISLTQGNGFAACSAIKAVQPNLPVVFLTASGDEFNTVTGFSMGADDYIAKPFRPRELMARITAILRRQRPVTESLLKTGDVVIDVTRARVTKTGMEIDLSAIEYRLLLVLATHPDSLVTRDALREALWDDACAYVGDNTISVYIKRLRQKLEDDPVEPRIILTVRGRGYKAAPAWN
ncbi:response regulator transcription factor [Atopobium fossor]|uniref:response regulator transcription factor n=1 Tax=Atopobium fossor TaxID=39487 RepID=UPI00041394DF|nr:response regulator transcription factor [Atopobium fossor]